MTHYTDSNNKKLNQNYVPPASVKKRGLDPLEQLELEKAMMGRGIDYQTVQQILLDFNARLDYLHDFVYKQK